MVSMFFRSHQQREAARLARERKTVTAMLRIYCRAHHGGRRGLCAECAELHAYVMCRLDRCPFGEQKPTCAACPIHCYRADRREQIREVMRYAGPRMLWHHPLSALRHLWDGRRTAEELPRKKPAASASGQVGCCCVVSFVGKVLR
jgi:hypothetical protein